MKLELYCVQLHGTNSLWKVFSCCDSLSLNYNLSASVRIVPILANFHDCVKVKVLDQKNYILGGNFWQIEGLKQRAKKEEGTGGEKGQNKKEKIRLSVTWIQKPGAGEVGRKWLQLYLNKCSIFNYTDLRSSRSPTNEVDFYWETGNSCIGL